VDKKLIHSIEISTIIIGNRQRKKLGNIEEFADSIKHHGQIYPIILTEDNKLVAGERRLRACLHLKLTHIDAIYRKYAELDSFIIEAIENIDRKALEWEEEVKITEELHKMLILKYGDRWSGRKTAEKIKMSLGGVSTNLQLAKALDEAPDIFEKCRTKEQALKALKKYKLDEAMAELALRNSKKKYGLKAKQYLLNGNSLDLIKQIPDASINVLLTDPPYGINLSDTMFHSTRDMPSENKDHYEDSTEYFKDLIEALIPDLNRILKPDSAVCIFCAYEHSKWLADQFRTIGYAMDVLPGIWVKHNAGRCNVPEKYFNRGYEYFVYGTRGMFTLAKLGTNNVIQCTNINTMDRIHPSEKPLELMEELLSRFCLPGHTTLDPFAGSCSSVVASIKRGCIPISFELDPKFYNNGLQRIAKALEMKDEGKMQVIQ